VLDLFIQSLISGYEGAGTARPRLSRKGKELSEMGVLPLLGNLTQTVASWPHVATGLSDSGGNFSITNLIGPGFKQRFYRIQVP